LKNLLGSSVKDLENIHKKLDDQWRSEKQMLGEINTLKEEEEQLRVQVEQAERAYDLNKAAQLKYGKLESLQNDLKEKETNIASIEVKPILKNLIQIISIISVLALSGILLFQYNNF